MNPKIKIQAYLQPHLHEKVEFFRKEHGFKKGESIENIIASYFGMSLNPDVEEKMSTELSVNLQKQIDDLRSGLNSTNQRLENIYQMIFGDDEGNELSSTTSWDKAKEEILGDLDEGDGQLLIYDALKESGVFQDSPEPIGDQTNKQDSPEQVESEPKTEYWDYGLNEQDISHDLRYSLNRWYVCVATDENGRYRYLCGSSKVRPSDNYRRIKKYSSLTRACKAAKRHSSEFGNQFKVKDLLQVLFLQPEESRFLLVQAWGYGDLLVKK